MTIPSKFEIDLMSGLAEKVQVVRMTSAFSISWALTSFTLWDLSAAVAPSIWLMSKSFLNRQRL